MLWVLHTMWLWCELALLAIVGLGIRLVVKEGWLTEARLWV